jgi:hypothetical protein
MRSVVAPVPGAFNHIGLPDTFIFLIKRRRDGDSSQGPLKNKKIPIKQRNFCNKRNQAPYNHFSIHSGPENYQDDFMPYYDTKTSEN